MLWDRFARGEAHLDYGNGWVWEVTDGLLQEYTLSDRLAPFHSGA